MGLFKKHNNGIMEKFQVIMNQGQSMTEQEFLDQLNEIIRSVELDTSYSTDEKLKIYELLSQISNCSASDRLKYAKKLIKVLK